MSFQDNISALELLNTTDWVVFFIILLGTILIVIRSYLHNSSPPEREDSFIDHLLMGRKLTIPLFVATLVATWYGGIFGVTAIAFEQGIYNFITQGLFWYLTYIVFALFIAHKVRESQAITLPELVGTYFGERSAKVAAVFNFFNVVPIAYTISLGILIQSLLPSPLWVSMLIGVSIVCLYSAFGGFRAVVISDFFQFLIMCSSVFLVLIFSIHQFGGISFLQANLPSTHFSPTGNVGLGDTLVWGLIALATLVDPNFYQRCFAAKDKKTAKKGILIATVIWFCFDICTTAGAMYAKAVIPHADSHQAYLTYALQILPHGLRGFFLGGIVATILSTMDSYLFLAGTTLSYDLFFKKERSVMLNRISVAFVGVLSIIMANLFQGNIKAVWKTLGSYSASCLLLPLLIVQLAPKHIAKRLNEKDFITCIALGVISVTFWRYNPYWNIDELYIACLIIAGYLIYPLFLRGQGTFQKN